VIAVKIILTIWVGGIALSWLLILAGVAIALLEGSGLYSPEAMKYGKYRGTTLVLLKMLGSSAIWPLYILWKYTRGMIAGE
jgi:hypothetical protein